MWFTEWNRRINCALDSNRGSVFIGTSVLNLKFVLILCTQYCVYLCPSMLYVGPSMLRFYVFRYDNLYHMKKVDHLMTLCNEISVLKKSATGKLNLMK